MDEENNLIDPTNPPLPKGYEPIKGSKENIPPLPAGYKPLKKKDSSDSVSTTQSGRSDSETKNGSSVGIKQIDKNFKLFPNGVVKTTSSKTLFPKINKTLQEAINSPENVAKRKEFQRQEILKWRESTKLNEEEKNESEAELEAKKKQEGLWNNIKAIGSDVVNKASEFVFNMTDEETTPEDLILEKDPLYKEKQQAKISLREQGVKNPNADEVSKLADKIYLDNTNLEKKQQKINSYLSGVDSATKSALQIDAEDRFKTLSKNKKELTDRISFNEKYFEELLNDLENPSISQQDKESSVKEILKVKNYLETDYDSFSKQSKELGTAQDEFDAFKRNYNALDNVMSRASLSLANAGVSLYSGANYLANTLGANEEYKQENIQKAKQFLEEKKNEFRPENKDITLNNFFQYSTDLLANQTGTLTQIGIGGLGGVVALGVEGAGDKYSEMIQEKKSGKNYTPTQMALAPFVSGLSEAVFAELPTIKTLKNSANVWKSALKESAGKEMIGEAVKNTSEAIAKNILRDTKKEVSTELINNIVQNAVKKDIQNDNTVGYFDNSIKTLKDTALLTGMIGSVGAMPHVAMSAVKTFSDKAESKQLDLNAKKITSLLNNISDQNVSETVKKVIQEQIDLATKQSSDIVNKTIDKMGKMPLNQIEIIYNNSKRISELQIEAVEIKDDLSLEDTSKAILLNGLKEEYKNLEETNIGIINGNISPVESLPIKEQDKIKKEALNELIQELNPDGTKNIKIDNDQITERANEIYSKQLKDAETESAVTKTESQVEVQKSTDETQKYESTSKPDIKIDEESNEYVSPLKMELKKINAPQKLIDAIGDNVKLKKQFIVDTGNIFKDIMTSGSYNGNTDVVTMSNLHTKLLKSNYDRVLLHEAVHAGTVLTYYDIANNPNQYTEKQYKSYTELKNIATSYIENTSKSTKNLAGELGGLTLRPSELYGLENEYEFMAEFVSNSKFREYLGKTSKDKKVNVVNYIWGKILGLFGLSKTEINQENLDNISKLIDDIFKIGADKNNYNRDILKNKQFEVKDSFTEKGDPRIEITTKDSNGDDLAYMTVIKGKEDNNYYVVQSELVDDHLKNRNIGFETYMTMINEANKRDIVVFSDYHTGITEDAEKVWEKLVKKGLAEKVGDKKGDPEWTSRKSFPVYKTILKNESQQTNDIATDENIRLRDNGDLQQQEIETIQPTSVVRESKADVEVTHKENVYSKTNEGAWINTNSGNEIKGIGEKGKSLIKTLEDKLKNKTQEIGKTDGVTSFDSRREKSSEEKAKDLGIDHNKYLDFKDLVDKTPSSGVFKEYLSGSTISEVFGEPTNNQSYESITLLNVSEHGDAVLRYAKELFEDNYIQKTLEFLDGAKTDNFEKAVVYASLENLLDTMVKDNPENKGFKSLQELVYKDSQANLSNSSKGLNAGRLRRIHNAIKNGFDVESMTDLMLSDKQKEAKIALQNIDVSGENLNKESDNITDVKLEKLITEGVQAEIKKLAQKLPTSRREKADKAIKALEEIQKSLRGKTYDATVGVPVAILDAGITVIKNALDIGTNLADAIEMGISHIREKHGKKWEENKFREDYEKGFKERNIDIKETKISNIVKQALIDAGVFREIKIKGEVRKVLDWVKLTGRMNNIEALRKNIENKLKEQGYTKNKISEISTELEAEYKRLTKNITDKAIADLERRNLIKPSPNRKSDNRRLADLYNQGLFGDNIKKYENAVNSILGFSDIDFKKYSEIQKKARALSDLFNQKVDGKQITELSISSLSSALNKHISDLLTLSAIKEGNVLYKTTELFKQFSSLGLKSLLGTIRGLAENKFSGVYAGILQKLVIRGEITPELAKQFNKNADMVLKDITEQGGLDYGNTQTTLVSGSLLEDMASNKIKSKIGHKILTAITIRRFLNGYDSYIKTKLTEKAFVINSIKILEKKGWSKESALKHISEALTGDSFAKALETAKKIIEDVNNLQETKQLKDNDETIHRFAMDIVKQNLIEGDIMTMEEVQKSYNSAYKGAGSDIGHEANNYLAEQVGYYSQKLNKDLNEAIKDKNWTLASLKNVEIIINKIIISPFAGGGSNWIVIGAEKGVPIIGYIPTMANALKRTELDLESVSGRKNIEKSLYYDYKTKSSFARNISSTGMALTAYITLYRMSGFGLKDDDEESNAKKLNDWLNENDWAKPYFNKLSPFAFVMASAIEDGNYGKLLAQTFGISGDVFNDGLKVLKSLDSKEDGATSGAIGKLLGRFANSLIAWKYVLDIINIKLGFEGKPQIKTDYELEGFLDGFYQGGFFEATGMVIDNLRGVESSNKSNSKVKVDKKKLKKYKKY